MEDVCRWSLYLWLRFLLFCPPLVDTAPSWTARGHDAPSRARKKTTAHTGQFFTAAISKFIEIDWFLQIIVKLILPLNTETKRGRPDWPQHQNRRLMAVKMCRDQYYQPGEKKKEIRTRALKVCPEQNSCKNRTVFFFPFDYLTHFVTNRFMIIIDIKSVSYWTIFPMKINKPQVWLFTNQRPSETWERK